jgi:hypothetical protein
MVMVLSQTQELPLKNFTLICWYKNFIDCVNFNFNFFWFETPIDINVNVTQKGQT